MRHPSHTFREKADWDAFPPPLSLPLTKEKVGVWTGKEMRLNKMRILCRLFPGDFGGMRDISSLRSCV